VGRNVFTIAPGAPYLETFVNSLLDGLIIAGVSRDSAPLELARITIYVPTQRAGRALAVEFARAIKKPAALLPRILPLGALDEQENAALFSDDGDVLDERSAPAIKEIDRRLILAQLVMRWAHALGHAVVSIGPDGAPMLDRREAMLVSPSPSNACALAKELGALIDEFIIENVDPSSITRLADESFDKYWAITAQFLRIAFQQWPLILEQRGMIDAARRQKALLEAQIDSLNGKSSRDPVIALGSTGSNPTTARLLDAISRLERGAVVLPGLDCDLDEAAWRHIGDAVDDDGEPAFTHPQSMLKRLLRVMKMDREQVRELATLTPQLSARRALIAQALRPADSTEHWRDFREREGARFASALQGVSIVEAPDERLEALTLALYMRQALETPGRTAALITPDRVMARRVSAELARFDIEIDDSGGEPLGATPIGALARLLCAIALQGASAVDIAALLAHPFAAFSLAGEDIGRLAPLVEIAVLRVVVGEGEGWTKHVNEAREAAKDTYAFPAARRLTDDDWRAVEDLLARVDTALAPMLSLARDAPLAARVAALRVSVEAVTAMSEPQLRGTEADAAIQSRFGAARSDGVEEFLTLLDKLEDAQGPLDFDAASFAAFLDALLFETIVRGPRRAHPRLKILGPLEARLIDADLLLVAGLDESIWPPQADAGAFLNRSMRKQLELSPPERRIGQSAHDFMMALGARDVVLSRAIKRAGSPTVASRFVTRLSALAAEAIQACKTRGDEMLAISTALDQPSMIGSCERPEPRPPVELRPTQLSVTRIETLRRDPYAIYAERILKLVPLAPLGAERGAREMGTAIHEVLADFTRAHPHGPLHNGARETLLALAREKLSIFLNDPGFAAFKWPRVEAGLDHALAFECARREIGVEIHIEERGDWSLTLQDGTTFRLTGFADRIEVDSEGMAAVFDYKTGAPPSNKQVCAGFAPQLTLEAAMIEAGAFKAAGAHQAQCAAYVPIGGAGDGDPLWIKPKDMSFADLVAEHKAQLLGLLNQFRNPERSYPSRPYVAFASRYGDYDHLARVKEWSRNGGGEQGEE
jgi:ATP-dependent helicase/nuclease subunit B